MICPFCAKEGKKSTLRGGNPISSTAMGYDSFYDEEGHHHVHDPNHHSTKWQCSNGHVYRHNWVRACDWGDYAGKDETVLVNEVSHSGD